METILIIVGAILLIAALVFLGFWISKKPKDKKTPNKSKSQRNYSFDNLSALNVSKFGKISEENIDEIKDALLAADIGNLTANRIIEKLRIELKQSKDKPKSESDLRDFLRNLLVDELAFDFPAVDSDAEKTASESGNVVKVILMVGVNGVGKTLTSTKLAKFLSKKQKVILVAADTFRAAATAQLETLADAIKVPLVKGANENQDPAAVVFQGVQTAIDQKADYVIVDTAGRLHNKDNLMQELEKIHRVAQKKGKVSEVILVIDATTGSSAFSQAKKFAEAAGVSAIALTKLDGSANGGIIFRIQEELQIPVKYIGVGEGLDDFEKFDPANFVDALMFGGVNL